MSIKVLIADDHPVLRTGLISLLASEPDIEIVGEAENATECVQMALDLAPNLILMDINMPGGSGLEALEEIRRAAPETKVLFLTMHDDVGYLKHVLSKGGSGYVLKHAASCELISAVKMVVGGGIFIHPQHARALASVTDTAVPRDDVDMRELLDRYDSLSQREAEVFELICLGHTNAEIADATSLSVKTVETYKSRLSAKLGISSRSGLVRAGIDLGILS